MDSASRSSAIAFLFALLLLPGGVEAQQRDDSWPIDAAWSAAGTRVRVLPLPKESKPTVGWVETWSADTLFLRTDPAREVVSFPAPSILGLQTSAGVKGHAIRGTFLGLFFGSILGLGVANKVASDSGGEIQDVEGAFLAWGATAAGGMIIGGVIGALDRSERWKTVWEQPRR